MKSRAFIEYIFTIIILIGGVYIFYFIFKKKKRDRNRCFCIKNS
jgi:hypothetical protein